MQWKVKDGSVNDDMRNQFLDVLCAVKIRELGITLVPDLAVAQKCRRHGSWEYIRSPTDESFRKVINGGGPLCNMERRMDARKWAEEKGRWVRKSTDETNRKTGGHAVV